MALIPAPRNPQIDRCRKVLLFASAVHFHFTSTYSSWLNQIEIWFSKVERDVIARRIFTSVKDLARKLRRYINAYSANAKPIQCKYSDPTRRIRSNVVSAECH
jgi:transposase